MAGQLDSLLKSVAKQVVADLGSSLTQLLLIQKRLRELTTLALVLIQQQTLATVSKFQSSLLGQRKMRVKR